jgi:thymidylate synthase (FAD)
MKLIKPSYQILPVPSSIMGIFRHIERIGRICYKSEEKITEDSCFKFVNMLCDKKHGAMLEHGSICLKVDYKLFNVNSFPNENTYLDSIRESKYTEEESNPYGYRLYTNMRVIWENNIELFNIIFDIAKGIIDPIRHLPQGIQLDKGDKISVHFICSRGISHEFIRHRTFSFAQESTRYCNYSKNKYNNQIIFIIPPWTEIEENTYLDFHYDLDEVYLETNDQKLLPAPSLADCEFLSSILEAESTYLNLIKLGWDAQRAREVLPNALKTELVITGSLKQWKEFFILRDSPSAHPQARELAEPLHRDMLNQNIIKNND